MKNVNPIPYVTPELEFFTFECKDILTASTEDPNGYVQDENVDYAW